MSSDIGVVRGTALYIGALLGPGLLLLPGLAAHQAGPASIVAWVVLLGASALFAVVFAALGVRHPSAGGVWGYARAGLGDRAGRAVAWCFLAGVIAGAPIVCVIGGNYVAELTGGGVRVAATTAALLLLGALGVVARGLRTSSTVQFGLVALLLAVVVGAVASAAPASAAANWTPFAPHGWSAVGRAAATLMLAFVGWEAIAPLTTRFAQPRRQLPVVIAIAFAATTVVYLALGTVTVAALGPRAGTEVPLAALLTLGLGDAGTAVAAVGAVVLTVGAVLAYMSGAAGLARALRTAGAQQSASRTGPGTGWGAPVPLPESGGRDLRGAADLGAAVPASRSGGRDQGGARPADDLRGTMPAWLALAILASGAILIVPLATGAIGLATLVNVPTTFFLVVYLGCTAAGWRLLRGIPRACSAVAFGIVAVVLGFCGAALIPAALVTAAAAVNRKRPPEPADRLTHHPAGTPLKAARSRS
ncbi:amino acid efflux transporter [Asanoa ferruginea]|uniref:Amino acid efflux transporter n=1 Tax=Asanoa ferruginea TaxID=53367 RepID=A0A3D9ZMM0_9ACTN|nr:APC family permease [Asanoa ferruginea]REF97173.1 amino acid efflux transporter [Asanoa ferruginea]GIF50123.1 amino acid permease [Asanoa ferruginea]